MVYEAAAAWFGCEVYTKANPKCVTFLEYFGSLEHVPASFLASHRVRWLGEFARNSERNPK